ncbi:hypothetical protein chiPu_0019460 [Chiloscyllium punctatum]|uniref:Uncharacterized protein n=1 Tax=Chiloscyllium punctatum TaxID=137246 RepID=A0A401RRX0_CHIPU|nr:hypothetical protein [Chiloscyllium punctatum]
MGGTVVLPDPPLTRVGPRAVDGRRALPSLSQSTLCISGMGGTAMRVRPPDSGPMASRGEIDGRRGLAGLSQSAPPDPPPTPPTTRSWWRGAALAPVSANQAPPPA